MNKKKSSFLNISAVLLSNVTLFFVGLVTKKFNLEYLGIEIIGINTTLGSLVSFSTLVDGGVATAIIYKLYSLIQENDQKKINEYTNVIRSCYNLIVCFITVLSIIFAFIIPFVLKGISIGINVYIYYFLLVSYVIFLYLYSYKRCILLAYMKNYICVYVDTALVILFSIFQILAVIQTKSFSLFLILSVLRIITSNAVINFYVNRHYPFLRKEKLNKILLKQVIPDIKNLYACRFASFLFNSSDNIIISIFVNTITVGIYSNYTMITTNIRNVVMNAVSSLSPILGNTFASNNCGNMMKYSYFSAVNLFSYFICMLLIPPQYVLLQHFITYYAGSDLLLSKAVVIVILIEQYISILRDPSGFFLALEGKFNSLKKIELVVAIVNLVLSLLFVYFFGIVGVILATIIARICQWGASIYALFFEFECIREIFKYLIKQLFQFLFIIVACYLANIFFDNLFNEYCFFVSFVLVGLSSSIIGLVLSVLYTLLVSERKFYLSSIKKMISKE